MALRKVPVFKRWVSGIFFAGATLFMLACAYQSMGQYANKAVSAEKLLIQELSKSTKILDQKLNKASFLLTDFTPSVISEVFAYSKDLGIDIFAVESESFSGVSIRTSAAIWNAFDAAGENTDILNSLNKILPESDILLKDGHYYSISSRDILSSSEELIGKIYFGSRLDNVVYEVEQTGVELVSAETSNWLGLKNKTSNKVYSGGRASPLYTAPSSIFADHAITASAMDFALAILMSGGILVLYRVFSEQSINLPHKNLLRVLDKKETLTEIDCPETYGIFRNLVETINKKIASIEHHLTIHTDTLNALESPFVVLDADNRIILENPAFQDNFLSDEANLIGKTVKTIWKQIPNDGDVIEILNKNNVRKAFKCTKTDFLLKNNPATLISFADVSDLVALQEKVSSRFITDELTSLYTRNYFTELSEAKIKDSPVGADHYFALIDINNFKILNDSAGHDVGDMILMELAHLISGHLDQDDIAGRMSGDEFVILFSNKTEAEVTSSLTSIYSAIKGYRITHCDTKIGVSASIGASKCISNGKSKDVRALLQQTDLAAMTAKKNGSVFKLYESDDTDIMFYREAPIWINKIKNAIANDRFELFVQEIQPLNNNLPLHTEILLRMQDDKGGFYPPNKFFEVAETFGLMKDIDEWVVTHSFQKILDGTLSSRVSINLSAETLKDKSQVEKIIGYADFYKIEMSDIVFEVTETMAISDLNTVVSNINLLRIKGFNIALDDFGSGYSTFNYIQSIPADYLKIDGSFVKNAVRSEKDREIISNMLTLAHRLEMHCVAEFVEDEETKAMLETLGIDYVQGYHIHKPEKASTWGEYRRALKAAS